MREITQATYSYEDILGNCLDMEQVQINFATQLEMFRECYFDAFQKIASQKVWKSSLDRLFISVLVTIVKEKYHYIIISKSEAIQGKAIVAQTCVLEVKNQNLFSKLLNYNTMSMC